MAEAERPLAGMAALVTGAGSGIGLACAEALAADGAAVTIMGRSEDKLQEALGELDAVAGDAPVDLFAGDVGVEEDVAGAVEQAGELLGGLHLELANAGTGGLSPVIATPLEEWSTSCAPT